MEIVILKSAYKHSISERAIRTCIANFLGSELVADEPEKYLLAGFDQNGNALELIVVIEGNTWEIIHAMKLRKQYYYLLRGKGT